MPEEVLLEYRFLHNKLLVRAKILSQGCWKIGRNIFLYILTLLQKQMPDIYTTIISNFKKSECRRYMYIRDGMMWHIWLLASHVHTHLVACSGTCHCMKLSLNRCYSENHYSHSPQTPTHPDKINNWPQHNAHVCVPHRTKHINKIMGMWILHQIHVTLLLWIKHFQTIL